MRILTRKEMKKQARQSVKKHYVLFLAICLISAFLGSEFSDSLASIKTYSSEITHAAASGTVTPSKGIVDVAEDIAAGDTEGGRKLSKKIEREHIEASKKSNPAFGRSRGVFARILNAVTSGSVLVTLASGLNSLFGSRNITLIIFLVLCLTAVLSFWILIVNMFSVISRRMFLEGRIYRKVPAQRVLFLLRVKKWLNAAKTMLAVSVLQALWSFTVIGGIIKKYSYYLVPYIVAENPSVKSRDAIRLSREIMNGHKWQCFVFELSFLGWRLLKLMTFGLSAVFYSNAYQTAAFCEYYTYLRHEAKTKGICHSDLMNDRYLFEKAEEKELQSAYRDVIRVLDETSHFQDRRTKLSRIFSDYLGIIFINTQTEKEYEDCQTEQIHIQAMKDAADGKSYPTRLSIIPENTKRSRIETLHYMRRYTVWSLTLIFFILSFLGWVWEVSLHLISSGTFINRGLLHGPWLPIYGVGGILILTVLNKIRHKPILEFISIVVLCGCVEYFTSVFLEITHNGERWWDYSGYFLNFHGRICAEGLLVFGIGGLAIVYVLAPFLDNIIKRLQPKAVILSCSMLLCLFLTDQVYSAEYPNTGKGITQKQ
ncbi:DUF975 family protein [Anaerostipes sp.]|uniref:DUF975 family protein n=1 Tax=Anaerostipes sp. TaxID=1872530 RepID=UPI0025C44DC7|nr:DUF975 family protein [Anaerostipes sp.]MBS7007284.1 DUF975 family protein [Anaerostipes sp.]